MVFVVEWLKGDRVVRKEAMLGAGIDDVLTTARSDVEELTQWSGSTPDRIRILDTSCGEAIVHEIGAPTTASW
jgi:hypothetical protein